jgi:Mn-dependent DtxR family transcriptional regulator
LHTYHRSTKDTSRVRDIAASLGVTERSAHGIVADLAEAGCIGRRNRCQIQAHPPRPEPPGGTRRR